MADAVDLLLKRLEAEYHATVAATRPRPGAAASPPAPQVETAEPFDDAEAEAEAAAAGYAQLQGGSDDEADEDGRVAYESSNEGDGEDAAADAPQYAALEGDDDEEPQQHAAEGGDAAGGADAGDAGGSVPIDPLPTCFIESALPTRTAYEASLRMPDCARAALERSARALQPSMQAPTDAPPAPEEWTADFSSCEVAAPSSLPAERVDQIRHAMAGMALAPPPPAWARSVPEEELLAKLLLRQSRAGKQKAATPTRG